VYRGGKLRAKAIRAGVVDGMMRTLGVRPEDVTLRFYFDYISPYAYLAWTQMPRIVGRHGRVVEPVPVLLAGLLGATGRHGPAEIAAQRPYVFRDAQRLAAEWGIEVRCPVAHPFNSLLALRVTSLVDDPATRTRVIDALFRAVWVERVFVDVADGVLEALAGLDVDAGALIHGAGEADAKQRLRRQTEQALADGAFGVPTICIDGELFWGAHALRHLEMHLSGAFDLATDEVERWRTLRPSAQRVPLVGDPGAVGG